MTTSQRTRRTLAALGVSTLTAAVLSVGSTAVAQTELEPFSVADRPAAGSIAAIASSSSVAAGDAVDRQSAGAEAAAAWAADQVGESYTDETSDGMWSGWCELFAEVAYGTRGQYASAIDNYAAQAAAGAVHGDTDPPVGALVFYEWGDYGHVGISVGGGEVVSTQGFSDPLPVRQHGVTDIDLPYLGWAYAPESWPGR